MNKDMKFDDVFDEVARVWNTDGRYSNEFLRASKEMEHIPLNHALMHVLKASGKIVCAVDDADHMNKPIMPEDIERFVADLVISACRISHTTKLPIDLGRAVRQRLRQIEIRDRERQQA